MQLKTTEKSYKLLCPFETLFLYSNIINQCGSGSTGSVEILFCFLFFLCVTSKTTNVSISEQRTARSGALTVTPLPWKWLRERGQSTSRAGRTHRLSWKAGDEGHWTDPAPPESVPSQVSPWDSTLHSSRLSVVAYFTTVMPVFSTFTPAIHSTKKKNKEMFAKSLIKLPVFCFVLFFWRGGGCSVVF